MNPGKLDKRISILEQSIVQNSYGEVENAWTETSLVWANIRPLQGRELFQAHQVHSEVTLKIIIRYRSNVQPNMRIQYGNRTMEIISVINTNEDNRFLELSCREVV